MPEIIGSLGSVLSSGGANPLMSLLSLGSSGAGAIGNIFTDIQRQQQINKLNSLDNPATLSKEVAQATQPLSSGLVQSVGNQVSGSLAEQGLSQAPGIQATELAQALAPFQQQNQNTALQLVLQQLGIPMSIIQGLGSNSNLSPLFALLMRQNNPGGTPGATPPTFAIPPEYSGGNSSDYTSSPSVVTDSPIDFGFGFSGANA
jgi:hypothetical protein